MQWRRRACHQRSCPGLPGGFLLSLVFLVALCCISLLAGAGRGTDLAPADGAGEEEPATGTPQFKPDQLLVRFRAGIGADRQRAVVASGLARVKTVRLMALRGKPVATQSIPGTSGSVFEHLAVVSLSEGADLASALARFRAHPDVLYAEPNYLLHLCELSTPSVTPNDPNFNQQWGMRNTGQIQGVPGADIHAQEAWSRGTGDARVTVAIIDTGIDYYHPDLEMNVWTNPGETPGDGIDDDGNGYIDDVHGYDFVSDDSDPMDDQVHGTHVAGIVGAAGNNGIGVSGVCWRVSLMGLKAFDEQGNGLVSSVVDAIQYAIRNGATVINASWGLSERSVALKEAIAAATSAGVVVVAAAGNSKTSFPVYPAAYEDVVAVAATDSSDHRASFSNYGDYVDLAAPGENVFSTVPNNQYNYLSGTSMSAPHVAGTAALVRARHPEFSAVEVGTILRNSVDPVVSDTYIGSGRLNAAKAMEVDVPLPLARLELAPVVFGEITINGTAAGRNFASYVLEYGAGIYPTNWTSMYASTVPVEAGALLRGFSTASIPEGAYTFRLRVLDASGQEARARTTVTVRNIQIVSPRHNDVLRAGDPISIRGTVFGPGRGYTVQYGLGAAPKEWLTDGITLRNGGRDQVVDDELAVWDTRYAQTNTFYTLKLSAGGGDPLGGVFRVYMIYLDGQLRPGWPQYISTQGDYPTNDWRDIKVVDLEHDGFQELIRLDSGNSDGNAARLLVYEHDGRLRWSRTLDVGEPYSDIPVVGDVDNDGKMEIFVDVGRTKQLFAFRHDGTPMPGLWPVTLEAPNLGKVLADLDGDGKLELIAYAQNLSTADAQEPRQLLVFDSAGKLLQKWLLPGCDISTDLPRMLPAVGNLDQDPGLEIIAIWGCDTVAAFSLKKPDGPLWTFKTDGLLVGAPVVGDLNGDRKSEIVVGSYDPNTGTPRGIRGGLYALDREGKLLPGWPVLVTESFQSTPALADFDGDGSLEIVACGWSSKLIHLIQANGFEHPGWPVAPFPQTILRASPVIGDVNNDGRPDVVVVSSGHSVYVASSGDQLAVGGVDAYGGDGLPIDLNPSPNLTRLIMESSGGSVRLKAAPATLTDIDSNGKLDIVAVSIDDRAYAPVAPISTAKSRYSIYVWELAAPFVAENMPWPSLQRGPQHTGYLPPVNQPPVVSVIPAQTVKPGASFFPIELDRYVEDPDDPPNQIVWTVEAGAHLQVSISPERVLDVISIDPGWVGTEALHFVAADSAGQRASVDAVYAILPGYQPPVAVADHATTREDTPVRIDVLANDTDPRGFPLRVLQVSRPLAGRAWVSGDGAITYQPGTNFYGSDSFTYTVSNDRDGMAIAVVTVDVIALPDPPIVGDDFAITLEDTPIEVDVLANDFDPDGDPISIVDFTLPAMGVVTPSANATLRYEPAANTNGLDSFTYRVTDGHGGVTQATVSVMVKPVNDPPTAENLVITMNRNNPRDIIFHASDPDGDPLSFRLLDEPGHGELWKYPAIATYYPKKDFSGTDRFSYVANDGQLDSLPATVTLTVLDLNNPPRAEDQHLLVRTNRSLGITLKATDLDDQPLVFSIVKAPLNGALEGSGTNYTYRPNPGFLGVDEFTFHASDGQDTSAEARISIEVTDRNTAPRASNSEVQVKINSPASFVLEAIDDENDILIYRVVSNPAHGGLSGVAPNLTYTPDPDYSGPDSFTFLAGDGQFESDAATVVLYVAPSNTPPETKDQSVTLPADRRSVLRLSVTDAEMDLLRCAILQGPAHGRIFGAGTNFFYTPKPGFTGMDSFTYKAWDGRIYSDLAWVYIQVSALTEDGPRFDGIQRLDSGGIQLRLRSTPGGVLLMQVSTNLTTWLSLPTTLAAGEAVVFVDTNAPTLPCRFYRALKQ